MEKKEFIQKEAECIYNGGFCFYDSIVNKRSISVLSLLYDMIIDHDEEALESLNNIITEKKEELEELEDYQKYGFAISLRNSLIDYVKSEIDLSEYQKEVIVEEIRSFLRFFKDPKTYPSEVYQDTYHLVKKVKKNKVPLKILVKQL